MNQGEKIDRLFALRAEKSVVQQRASEIEEEIEGIEREVYGELAISGTDRASTRAGTVSMTEEAHPTVRDWDAFLDWVAEDRERRAFLFRRINGGPFRELLRETGAVPPGAEAFVRRGLSYRRS